MVHFESNDHESARGERIAPVTYLPGAFGARPVAGGAESWAPSDTTPADAAVDHSREHDASQHGIADNGPAYDEVADDEIADDEGAEDEIADDEIAEFDPVAEREHAESLLLSRLRSRSLSVVEATSVLAGTDVSEEDIDDILTRFADLNYLDDNKLADQIIHTHHARKGLGRSGVEAEMRRRKVDQFVILEKLDELPDEEIERATELALTRVRQLSRVDDDTADRRLTGFLLRKGYSSAAVRTAVKAALATRLGSGRTSTVRFQ